MDTVVKERELLALVVRSLSASGVNSANANAIARNIVAAERHGKRSHGLVSCLLFEKYRDNWTGPTGHLTHNTVNASQLEVNAGFNSGHLAMEYALEASFREIESSKLDCVLVEVSEFQASVGYAGEFGRHATKNGFGYLGFHNCHGGLHVDGVAAGYLGTNPFVIAMPISNGEAMVFDSSCAQKSWSAKYLDQMLNGVDDDDFAVEPWGGQKGVGLSIAIEVLVASLSGSKAFRSGLDRGLGSIFFLF